MLILSANGSRLLACMKHGGRCVRPKAESLSQITPFFFLLITADYVFYSLYPRKYVQTQRLNPHLSHSLSMTQCPIRFLCICLPPPSLVCLPHFHPLVT